MKDRHDSRTEEIPAFPLPPASGRPRVHASNADRQRAYRERCRGKKHQQKDARALALSEANQRALKAEMHAHSFYIENDRLRARIEELENERKQR